MPNYPNSLVVRAAIYGQLGRLDEGRALVRDVEAKMPGITDRHNDVRRKWLPKALADHIQEGLDKLSPARHSSESAAAASPAPAAGASIAVLPFTDLSPTKDQDWFCDGIAEEILNALAPLPGLRVAARASSFSLRGKRGRPARHRREAERRHRARGQRAARRRSRAHHGAVERRRRRAASCGPNASTAS